MKEFETETVGDNITHVTPVVNSQFHADTIKFLRNFRKFFSNVSLLSVADSTPIETQLELMRAMKEVG